MRQFSKKWNLNLFLGQEQKLIKRVRRLESLSGNYSCFKKQNYRFENNELILETNYIVGSPAVFNNEMYSRLLLLSAELEDINKWLPHGDINIKNVVCSGGYLVLIDWEPLLELTNNGFVVFRATHPYLSMQDYLDKRVTIKTDKLGFFYLCRKLIYGWFPTSNEEARQMDILLQKLSFTAIAELASCYMTQSRKI